MDSEVLCSLFVAIREKRSITLETINRYKDRITENHVVPLKVMISVQSGRQYLMAYKSLEDIIEVIHKSVDVIDIIKPVYNFKAAEDDLPWKKRKENSDGETDSQ